MTSTAKRLELVSWLIAAAAPALFFWIPSAVFTGEPFGDYWGSIVVLALCAASPFLILAGLAHVKNRRSQSKSEATTYGLVASFITTTVLMVILYIFFWLSVCNASSPGVNFGMSFLVLVSPFLFCPIIGATYAVGVRFGKRKVG